MSTIGLYDMDMANYGYVLPNLEIMKMSQYFRSKYFITKFTLDFTPEKYTTFYVRKDYNDHYFPQELYQNNIICGGSAFTNNLYTPMDLEIEKSKPHPDIYTPYAEKFSNKKYLQEEYKLALNSQNLRLSLDGKNLWDDYAEQLRPNARKHFIFHDLNLNEIKGIKDFLKDLLKENPKYNIGVKYPIQLYDSNDLLWWGKIPIDEYLFSIQFNGIISNEAWEEYISTRKGNYKQKYLIYNITYGCPSEEVFCKEWLPKIYRQLIFSRMNCVKILLKYDDQFFIDPKWLEVMELFQLFIDKGFGQHIHQETRDYCAEASSMYGLVKNQICDLYSHNCSINKVKARNIFMFIKEKNYQLFNDFYQVARVKLQGDQFVNDTAGNRSESERIE